jgi:hypothetical protein
MNTKLYACSFSTLLCNVFVPSTESRFRLFVTSFFAISVLLACGDQTPQTSSTPESGVSAVEPIAEIKQVEEPRPELECERLGYACTAADVDKDAADRTIRLLTLARDASRSGDSLAGVVALLESQDDVVWVTSDEHAIRFLPSGGRPVWIVAADALIPGTRAFPTARFADGVAGKNESDFSTYPYKSALILSPFQWEFGSQELDDIKNALQGTDNDTGVKDYKCGDCITERVRENFTDVTTWMDFTGWQNYQLIHLSTHGLQLCEIGCQTFLMTGWQLAMSPEALLEHWEQQSLMTVSRPHGVELMWMAPSSSCERPPVPLAFEPAENEVANQIPASSERYKLFCGDYLTQTPMLSELVTDDFFLDQYKSGLPDKIIFLSACESMKDTSLAQHLATGGNTAVLGWTRPVDNDVAIKLANKFYDALLYTFAPEGSTGDGGKRTGAFRVKDAYEKAKGEDAGGILTMAGSGLVRGPGGLIRDAVSGGDLIKGGLQIKRAREVIAFLDPDEGREVKNGARLDLEGVPGDGENDKLDVVIEVVGIGDDQNMSDFPLHMRFDDTDVAGTYELNESEGDGTAQFRGLVELGFDAEPDKRYNVNVWTDMPGGGISRWLYEDIVLGKGCEFSAMVGGSVLEPFTGDKLQAFDMGPGKMIGLEQQRDEFNLMLMVTDGSKGSLTGSVPHAGDPTGRGVALGEVSVSLTSNSDELVEGSARGTVQVVPLSDPADAADMPISFTFSISRGKIVDEQFDEAYAASPLGMMTGGSGVGCEIP